MQSINIYMLMLLVLMVGLVKAQRSCYTPNRAYGQCVHYKRCAYITVQLQNFGQAIPQSFRDYVQKSRCSTNSNEIFVCCEPRDIESETTTTSRTTTTEKPISLEEINERGLNILKATKCGDSSVDRVAFGNETKLAEFPWMVLLKYNSPEKFNCGGSLITNRYVLTAAHCLVGQRFDLTGVRLGEHDINKDIDCKPRGKGTQCMPPAEDFGIEKTIIHPNYASTSNDIALIRLDRNVEFKIHIQPICLPITEKSRQLQNDQQYFISGWGTTETGSTSAVLLKAIIPHRSIDYCQRLFKNYKLSDIHICAGAENRVDSCKGDSGGPLFFVSPYELVPRYVQYGVVSFGVRECGPETSYPSLYTRVEAFLPWITNQILS